MNDANSWKDKLCSWIGRITIVKITTLQIQCNPYQKPMAFFTDKNIYMEMQKPLNSQSKLEVKK